MASTCKPRGKSGRYSAQFFDATGVRRTRVGFTDKQQTYRLAIKLEDDARRVAAGLVPPGNETLMRFAAMPVVDHIDAFEQARLASGVSPKQANQVV